MTMKRDLLTEVSLKGEAQDVSVDSAVALTVNLVRAYVSNHIVPPAQLAALLEQTHRTVLNLANLKREEPEPPIPPVPAGAERITCLECGKSFRSLKRHLSVQHGLTPDAYRMRWGLPSNYPVTSPDYAATRSSIARARGLGKRPEDWSNPTVTDEESQRQED
jgi:predicted transcriptional regulator